MNNDILSDEEMGVATKAPPAGDVLSDEEMGIGVEPGLMSRVGSGIMTGLEKLDSWTGAPTRAALSAGIKGENPVSAFASQFNAPTETTPTGKDIAGQLGLSKQEYLEIPQGFETGVGFESGMGGYDLGLGDQTTKVSPAGVAGLGIDVLADWTNALTLAPRAAAKTTVAAAEGAYDLGRKGITEADKMAGSLGKKAIQNTLGVRPEAVQQYLERGKELKNINVDRPAIGSLKERIDASTMPFRDELTKASRTVDQAKDVAQAQMEDLRALEAATGVNLERAKAERLGAGGQSVVDRIAALDKKVSDLSAESFDILKESGAQVKIPQIKAQVTALKNSLASRALTDEQVAVVNLLQNYRERLNGFGKEIGADEAKKMVQALDREIKYLAPGEIGRNSTLDQGLQDIRRSFDRQMKKVPEYEAKMKEVSQATRDLMAVKDWSSQQAAVGAIKAANTPAGLEKAAALKKLGIDPSQFVGEQGLPEAIKAAQVRQAIIEARKRPGVDLAQQALEAKRQEVGPFRDLIPDEFGKSTNQSAIMNQLRPTTASFETEGAIKALDEKLGTKFADDLDKMRRVAPFTKEYVQGSANTNMFKAIGSFIGGLMGAPYGLPGISVGAATGGAAGAGFGRMVVDRYGPKYARQILDKAIELKKYRPKEWIKKLDVPPEIKMDLLQQLEEFYSLETQAAIKASRAAGQKRNDSQAQPSNQP